MSSLSVTACGMVSSLGLDVATSCAAARAGLVRSEELFYYPVRSPEDGSMGSAVGYPVSLLAKGFEGDARLLRLAVGALSDLKGRLTPEQLTSKRVGIYIAIPDLSRTRMGLEPISSNPTSQQRADQSIFDNSSGIAQQRDLQLWKSITELCGWPMEHWFQYSSNSGYVGVAEALARASLELTSDMVDVAIVGGVDSFLDEDTLAWLEETNRLKTPANPVGLQPGEAAAFVMVERTSSPCDTADPMVRISSISQGKEPNGLFSNEPCTGLGLADLICLNKEWRDSGVCWIVSDQNGESYRASEWGNVLVRLADRVKPFPQLALWCPAVSFGDTGAASGAVALCVAVRAFYRKYAPDSTVSISSTGETSLRSVIQLTASVS